MLLLAIYKFPTAKNTSKTETEFPISWVRQLISHCVGICDCSPSIVNYTLLSEWEEALIKWSGIGDFHKFLIWDTEPASEETVFQIHF